MNEGIYMVGVMGGKIIIYKLCRTREVRNVQIKIGRRGVRREVVRNNSEGSRSVKIGRGGYSVESY